MRPRLLTALVALVSLLLTHDAGAVNRMNVLIVLGDDHSYPAIGAYGSTVARTPNIDRLAATGVRFDRAYCNAPMCTPSRQSFLTGRYPQCTGVRLLTDVLSDDTVTLAERLADAGYRTGAFGKMHFNSAGTHGFKIMRTEREWPAHDRSRPRRPLPPDVKTLPPWKPFQDHARVWLNGTTLPVGRYDEEMQGTWYAREAIAFMSEASDRPFFAQVSFHEPHSPYWFPVDFEPRYDPAGMLVPELGPQDRPQVPKIFADLTRADKQGILASYHTSAAYLDVNVGRVLDALDRLGLADNTLVVYLGDNGYMLGQHGRFEKHCFYEQAVRVPLIIRPGAKRAAGLSTDALVEFVDIVPTVLDLVGLGAANEPTGSAADLQGISLRPLLAGDDGANPWPRQAVFSEYLHNEEAMVRTKDWKLVYRSSRAVVEWYEPVVRPAGRQVRLYDLRTDPAEERDLASDPEHKSLVQNGLQMLADWYRRCPPRGETPPSELAAEDLLDWALHVRKTDD